MDSRNSISKILNRLENEMPMVEEGDIIETIKTIYPSLKIPKKERNIVLEGVEMTMPLASSRESKMLLNKENSKLLNIFEVALLYLRFTSPSVFSKVIGLHWDPS